MCIFITAYVFMSIVKKTTHVTSSFCQRISFISLEMNKIYYLLVKYKTKDPKQSRKRRTAYQGAFAHDLGPSLNQKQMQRSTDST